MAPILSKYLALSHDSSKSSSIMHERTKDHYSHFILRLAFSGTEELRRRFSRLETQLFRLRFQSEDARAKTAFVESLGLEWEKVSAEERDLYREELAACSAWERKTDLELGWFKVDWEKVPELVESRRVFLRGGKAFVPVREQTSMVVGEFTRRLDHGLEVRASATRR